MILKHSILALMLAALIASAAPGEPLKKQHTDHRQQEIRDYLVATAAQHPEVLQALLKEKLRLRGASDETIRATEEWWAARLMQLGVRPEKMKSRGC